MNIRFSMLLLSPALSVSLLLFGQKPIKTSVCAIRQNQQDYIHKRVQVTALLRIAFEDQDVHEGECALTIAWGNDYQRFGNQFPVRNDRAWNLLRALIGGAYWQACKPGAFKNLVSAKLTGTIEPVHVSGEKPDDPVEVQLIIQEAAHVKVRKANCVAGS
jgi:hypothetical protein